MDIKATLKNLKIDLKSIEDENLRGCFILLLNAVEQLSKENEELRKKNQDLTDENNRLKGEQGKPNFRPQTNRKNNNISSEEERKGDETDNKNKHKSSKPKAKDIKIDRVERCEINKEQLPPDAVFKGYEPVIVQDIKITTDNIKFERAAYYSPSQKKTYYGKLPTGYQGQFGPE